MQAWHFLWLSTIIFTVHNENTSFVPFQSLCFQKESLDRLWHIEFASQNESYMILRYDIFHNKTLWYQQHRRWEQRSYSAKRHTHNLDVCYERPHRQDNLWRKKLIFLICIVQKRYWKHWKHCYTVPAKANRPLLKVFQRLNMLNTVKMISNLTWF